MAVFRTCEYCGSTGNDARATVVVGFDYPLVHRGATHSAGKVNGLAGHKNVGDKLYMGECGVDFYNYALGRSWVTAD